MSCQVEVVAVFREFGISTIAYDLLFFAIKQLILLKPEGTLELPGQ